MIRCNTKTCPYTKKLILRSLYVVDSCSIHNDENSYTRTDGLECPYLNMDGTLNTLGKKQLMLKSL